MTKARAAILTSGLASLVLAIAGSRSHTDSKPTNVGAAPQTSIAGKNQTRLMTKQRPLFNLDGQRRAA